MATGTYSVRFTCEVSEDFHRAAASALRLAIAAAEQRGDQEEAGRLRSELAELDGATVGKEPS